MVRRGRCECESVLQITISLLYPKAPTSKTFPDLEMKIKHAIEELEGDVFPKLNWSAPKVNILMIKKLKEVKIKRK